MPCLVWSEAHQGLEPTAEVVGGDEVAEVLPELVAAIVMVAFDGGLLDGPFIRWPRPSPGQALTVGPGMLHLGQAVLDAVLSQTLSKI